MTDSKSSVEQTLDELLTAKQQGDNQVVDVDELLIKLVIFQLADKYFALPGHSVKEVLSNDIKVNFVPGMHDSVEGVINLRGDIESVLSLNHLLQLPSLEQAQNKESFILHCAGAGITTGIRIDALLEVVDVPESQLKPPLDSLPEHMQPYVTALLSYNDWPIALLNLDLLLQAWRTQTQPQTP